MDNAVVEIICGHLVEYSDAGKLYMWILSYREYDKYWRKIIKNQNHTDGKFE